MVTPEKNTETRFERYRKTWWFWLLTGLFTVALTLYGFNVQIVNWRIAKTFNDICLAEFSKSDSSFNILILPFERIVKNNTYEIGLEKKIQQTLQELAVKNNLNFEIIVEEYASFKNIETEVFKYSQDRNAHLVIYGDFSELVEKELEVRIKWKLIRNVSSYLGYEGDTGDRAITALSEVNQGYLLKDPTYIATWTLGVYDHYIKKYDQALLKFKLLYAYYLEYAELDEYLNIYLANTYYLLSDFKMAEKYFRRTINLNARNTLAMVNLGAVYYQTQRIDSAYSITKNAIQLNTNHIEGWINLAILEMKLGNIESSKQTFSSALEMWPNDPILNYNYAQYFYNHEKNYRLSAKYLHIAYNSSPQNVDILNGLSKVYIGLGDSLKALDFATKSYDIDPKNVYTLHNLAMLESFLLNFNSSIDYFTDALKIDSDNEFTNIGIFTILPKVTKGLIELEEIYDRVIQNNNRHEFAWINLALIMHKKGQHGLGYTYIKNAVRLNPKNFRSRITLGDLYFYDKNYKSAIKEYKIAIDLNFNDPVLLQRVGEASFHLGKFRDTEKYFNASLKINPNNPALYWKFGSLVYLQFNDSQKAIEYLNSAIQFDPKYAKAYLLLSNIYYYKFGQKEIAKQYYITVCSLDVKMKSSDLDSIFNVK